MKTLIIIVSCLMVGITSITYAKQSNSKEIQRTKATYELQNKLITLGFTKDNAKIIIDGCKKKEKENKKYNAYNCVIVASMIGVAESSAWNNCKPGNCMGLMSKKKDFNTWLNKWGKYWYKSTHPISFYSFNGKPSKHLYCTDEVSSGLKKFNCPNGYKHALSVYLKLKK